MSAPRVLITDLPTIDLPIPLPKFTEARCYEDVYSHGHVVLWDHINHIDIDAHDMNRDELISAIMFGLDQLEAARRKIRKRLH